MLGVVPSLVSFELSLREPDLLSWFKSRHSKIRTAGTTKGIAQVTLQKKKKLIWVLWGSKVLTFPHEDVALLLGALPPSSASSSAKPHVLYRGLEMCEDEKTVV